MPRPKKSLLVAYALWSLFGPLGLSNLYFANLRRTALTFALSILGVAGALYFVGLPLMALAFMLWIVDGLNLRRLVVAHNGGSPLIVDVAAGFALVDPKVLPQSDRSNSSRLQP